jgi:hypothetical protein
MTLYFNDVFKALCQQEGLEFQNTAFSAADPESADIILSHDSCLDLGNIRQTWRSTHMVRDPRDLLISAYFYHLRTKEEWCVEPSAGNHDLPPDMSYQQHLRSLGREQGILYELGHVSGRITELMGRWDYSSPGVLELRYEDVLGNEAFWFKRIFKWYGFSGDMVSKGVEIALRYSQEKLRPGDPGHGHGNRKSRPGYWREHFTDPIRKAFRNSYGDVLVKLGYESGPDW